MRMESEDIRNLPLHMQEQVAMAFVPPAAEPAPVAGKKVTVRRRRFYNKRSARIYRELRALAAKGIIDVVVVNEEHGIVRSVFYVMTEDSHD